MKVASVITLIAASMMIGPASGIVSSIPQDFVPVTPCAVADTRLAIAPSPNGKLAAGVHTFQVAGDIPTTQRDPAETCVGAPGDAPAVMVNVVAIEPDGVGNLRISAAGETAVGGVVNYQALTPGLNNSNAVPTAVSTTHSASASGNVDVFVNGQATYVRLVVLGYFTVAPTQTAATGLAQVNNIHPVLGINCAIALGGTFPPRNVVVGGEEPAETGAGTNSVGPDPYIGAIGWFGGNFAPRDWALCEGQLLPISQNQALFSILGTSFGGDGRTTFALPDMRGRSPMGIGDAPGLSNMRLGERKGTEVNTIVPSHSHSIPVATPSADGEG